ncbi:uncharacterized protein VTP21DRAFT_5585 [Calcarisporiella thermophila]|uniref:uncharacterized protein n=1 Tax=Calcarisporiella thermophila TaxID=911321 RepID=UPI003742F9D0
MSSYIGGRWPPSLDEKQEMLLPIANVKSTAIPSYLSPRHISLVILILQNTSLVLMMSYSRIVQLPNQPLYLASTAVFLAEVIKIAVCFGALWFLEKRSLRHVFQILRTELITGDTVKMFFPACLYALQNNLLYVAISNLEAASFQVTYQMKILSTAVFSVIILRRTITAPRWFALVLLMIGVTLVQLQSVTSKPSSENEEPQVMEAGKVLLAAQNPLRGLLAVMAACISSGFAGCYFEKILKSNETSIWVRNIQLGFSSLIFSVLAMVINDWHAISASGLLQGYNTLTYFVVLNQALGGLLVAIVVKYADNILKGFATSLSIILSSVISCYLFNFHLSFQFCVGAAIVMLATALYGRPPVTFGSKQLKF